MSTARSVRLAAAGLIPLGLATGGCGEETAVSATLAGTTWAPVEVAGRDTAGATDVDDLPLQLVFESADEWNAGDGCNRVDGTYSVDGIDWRAARVSTTDAGCTAPVPVPVPAALASASRVELSEDGERLTFSDVDGAVAVFEAAPSPP